MAVSVPWTASAPERARTTPLTLLVSGAVLTFFAFMRFGIGELGWIVFAPLLVFVIRHASAKRHMTLLATLLLAWLATVSKIVTSEIPWAPAPMYAVPIASSYFIALTVAGLAFRRLGPRWGVYTFAATALVLGWIQYSFTGGASWGILAHTQANNLPLIQVVSLTGLGGLTFLVALGSGLAAAAWTFGAKAVRADVVVFAALLAAAMLYGEVRLATPPPGPPLLVGAVVSPVTHEDFYAAASNPDSARARDGELFARSGRAVDRGAAVVVWNEVGTVVSVASEAALVSRGQAFAKDRGVLLMMAYAVVDSTAPLHYRNKYRLYLADGSLGDEYVKRHPVPGDPHDAGGAHARVASTSGIRVTGAICYDYSFPEIARDNASDGADIALVPSSDWRGIDPLHGRMALMNAVAVGLAMVRPVRAATSIASDQYGRLLGSLAWDGNNDGVMVVEVPGRRVPTLYARTGELLPLLALAFCLFVLVRLWQVRHERPGQV